MRPYVRSDAMCVQDAYTSCAGWFPAKLTYIEHGIREIPGLTRGKCLLRPVRGTRQFRNECPEVWMLEREAP